MEGERGGEAIGWRRFFLWSAHLKIYCDHESSSVAVGVRWGTVEKGWCIFAVNAFNGLLTYARDKRENVYSEAGVFFFAACSTVNLCQWIDGQA